MISKNFYCNMIKKILDKILYGIKKFEKKQQNNSNNFNLFYGKV